MRLAGWIAKEAFGAADEVAGYAARAGRLSKADLTTDMVREFTELQGVMGGIYAREERLPEAVCKATAGCSVGSCAGCTGGPSFAGCYQTGKESPPPSCRYRLFCSTFAGGHC